MFLLGGRYAYLSKAELQRELKAHLKSDFEGQIRSPILAHKLHCLLLLHPHSHRKIGSGIRSFRIERNHFGSGKSFVVVKSDGTSERFSYKKCLNGCQSTHRSKVIEALRFIVRPQIIQFRKSISLPAKCEISGVAIEHNDNLEIDHVTPFSNLVEQFIELRGINLDDISLEGSGENLKLTDHSLARDFDDFHRKNADLRPAHARANAEKGASLANSFLP